MRKILALISLALLSFELLAVSFIGKDTIKVREDLFYSEQELEEFRFEDKRAPQSKEDFYSECDIYLLTGGPGSILWENFGHSSYIVKYPNGEAVAYDYGIFTFDESFFKNFALGRLYYEAWRSWADYRVNALIEEDRDVSLLPLDLSTDGKYALISFLDYNTRPENSVYLYDYYLDNCATRLRDSFDATTGGEFRRWAESKVYEETLRDLSERYLSRSSFPVAFAVTFLLGPSVDEGITLWDAMFLPDILEEGIALFQGNESISYHKSETREQTPASYGFMTRTIAMALIFAAIILLSRSKNRAVSICANIFSALIFLALSLMELALAFLMTSSIHSVTYFNLNILLFAGAPLLLCLHAKAIFNRDSSNSKLKRASRIMLFLTLAFILVKALLSNFLIQDMLPYSIFMVILYIAECFEIKGK